MCYSNIVLYFIFTNIKYILSLLTTTKLEIWNSTKVYSTTTLIMNLKVKNTLLGNSQTLVKICKIYIQYSFSSYNFLQEPSQF